MPPRRRNKANSARSAAIRAVRRREGGETVVSQTSKFMSSCYCFPKSKENQCIPVNERKSIFSNKILDNDDDSDIPDLLDPNDDRFGDGDYDPRGEEYISEDEDDDDEVEDEEEDEGCLHCQSVSNDIQVHCDECQAYVCDECHWCHEYQANHEIRVCDRCDAFYCRGCDEMDQCEDCGEVVCASCSTLLSCKFCGGGLCEECATACGRCGIVLCSRDAKFAVECDTCRLSYCLVCLASGSKDPCVRCGHRPSKRMEQLVHLRLKSIYKAFKQSNSNSAGKMSQFPNHGGRNTATIEMLEDYEMEDSLYDPDSAMLMAAKAANHHMLDPTSSAQHYAAREIDFEHALVENYIQEKQKADAAAEALLAELEEEEEAEKTKKKKKKRKKERQQAAKREEEEKNRQMDEKEITKKAIAQVKKAKQPSKETETTIVPTTLSAPQEVKLSPPKEPAESTSKFDQIESKLFQAVEDGDIEGIEEILLALKGVPGRAVLRKNAKKALKRLRSLNDIPAGFKEAEEASSKKELSYTNEFVSSKSKDGVKPIPSHIPTTSTGTLLKIVSDTNTSKPNRHECVMQMSPAVVGWVIGKGGQRIRDLMEESGAKIWIDQEKAKAAECRNVYISGERNCVDRAVKMVQDVVSKAPIGQQLHQQQQLVQAPRESKEADTKGQSQQAEPKANAIRTGDFNPLLQNPVAGGNGSVGVNVSSTNPQEGTATKALELVDTAVAAAPTMAMMDKLGGSSDSQRIQNSIAMEPQLPFQQILTCEACFVPLLIGKRGWTIKNIQDESGARVDIDQSVTPRQIKISGSKANVEIAIGMVRDVLSYPHAQLQQPIDAPPTMVNRSHSPSPSASRTTSDPAMRADHESYVLPSPHAIPADHQNFGTGAGNAQVQRNSMRSSRPVNGNSGPPSHPIHPGLSGGPPFLMGGPQPDITRIGMPAHPLQQTRPPFYAPGKPGRVGLTSEQSGYGGNTPQGGLDFGMMGGMRPGAPPASMERNAVPSPITSSHHQYHIYNSMNSESTLHAGIGSSHSAVPPAHELWNPRHADVNGNGLPTNDVGQAAPAASLRAQHHDSDLIDSLFGPVSEAKDPQIDALFKLDWLSINDHTTFDSGLWGPSSVSDWPSEIRTDSESKDQNQPLPDLTESSSGKALQHPPESRFDWNSMGS